MEAQNEILVEIGPSSSSRGRALLGCLSAPLMYVAVRQLRLAGQEPNKPPEERQERQTAKGSNQALKRHLLAMQKTNRTIQDPILVVFLEKQASMVPALRSTDEILIGELEEIVAQRGRPSSASLAATHPKPCPSILVHSRAATSGRCCSSNWWVRTDRYQPLPGSGCARSNSRPRQR